MILKINSINGFRAFIDFIKTKISDEDSLIKWLDFDKIISCKFLYKLIHEQFTIDEENERIDGDNIFFIDKNENNEEDICNIVGLNNLVEYEFIDNEEDVCDGFYHALYLYNNEDACEVYVEKGNPIFDRLIQDEYN